jgi:hypothetical protein
MKAARKARLMCFEWLIFKKGKQFARVYSIVVCGMNATSTTTEYLGLVDGLEALVDIGIDYEPVCVMVCEASQLFSKHLAREPFSENTR